MHGTKNKKKMILEYLMKSHLLSNDYISVS